MNFNFIIGDMELRSCNKQLLTNSEHYTAEIVCWNRNEEKEYCYTIAYWVKGKEGYYLKFVGNRPFDKFEYWNDFGKLAKQGQEILNEYFEKENNND